MTTYSAIDWAREHGDGSSWFCLANGYNETDQRSAVYSGYVYRYANEHTWGETRAILVPDEHIKDGTSAIYLLDDGRAVIPYYVAGWDRDETAIYLAPFPTNFDSDGNAIMRGDDATRPVDFTTWRLNPARAYHLKLR